MKPAPSLQALFLQTIKKLPSPAHKGHKGRCASSQQGVQAPTMSMPSVFLSLLSHFVPLLRCFSSVSEVNTVEDELVAESFENRVITFLGDCALWWGGKFGAAP